MKSKKYIFVIPSICNIGGAQLYLVEKIRYLLEKGWDVDVIYARKDIILVKELEKFADNCYPFLDYSTMYFRKGFVMKKVKEIANKLNGDKCDTVVIESCTVSISTWCELIAKELGCKHINYAFEELFEMSKSQLKFAYFKHCRHELAGIRKESVPLMFKGSDYDIKNPEYYIACGAFSIDNVPDDRVELLKKYDVVIGSFGRLNKGFVWDAVKEIHKYMVSHSGRKYALLLIGDTKDIGFKNKICELFTNIADVIITGEVFPASLDLVNEVDAFVSSSGAATSTASRGIPTIAISPETFLPNGILNYTTKYNIMAPSPSEKTTSELLEDIIDNHYCETHPDLGMYDKYFESRHNKNWQEFDRQMSIAMDDSHPQRYYDVFQIQLEGKRKYVSYFSKIFGYNAFAKAISIAQKYHGTLIRG